MVVDAVLHVRGRRRHAPEADRIGVVVGEQELGLALGMEPAPAERLVLGLDDGVAPAGSRAEQRPLRPVVPGPRVPEPEGRDQVEGGRVRAAIGRAHADQEVVDSRLRVLDGDVPVAVVVEDAGVEELELRRPAGPPAVFLEQRLVREGGLRILVEALHVRVRGRGVEVEVALLHVLAVVAFLAGETEQALLEDPIAAVPEGEGEAESLVVVRDPEQAVLAPPVRAGPRVVVGEVVPGRAAAAVVLTHRGPLALGQVRPPSPPVGGARFRFPEPPFLAGHPGSRIGKHDPPPRSRFERSAR